MALSWTTQGDPPQPDRAGGWLSQQPTTGTNEEPTMADKAPKHTVAHRSTKATAPDGWVVEVITLDGRQWFRVKQHGYLRGGPNGPRQGLHDTVASVRAVMGDDVFAQLEGWGHG